MGSRNNLAGADEAADATAKSRPTRRVLVFGIIALSLLMMSVDSTIVASALHPLQLGLHTSINWAGWTLTAYSFGFVLMLPLSGRLSERYGRRRVFLGSVVAFTAASLLCGLANNIYVLIALRAMQAAGGAGLTPSATGIVVDQFGNWRDRAISLFGSIFPIGAMIGPVFGGLFVSYGTWRGIFLVNVPIGVAVIGLGLRYIPRDRPRSDGPPPKMDLTGMALLAAGLVTSMFAATYLGQSEAHAWSPAFIAPLVIAVISFWAFFQHVKASARPFIVPALIYGSGFGAVNLLNALYGGVTFGMVALIPLYAINRYGLNGLQSATLLTAQGLAAILFSVLATFALRRTGHRLPLYVGSLLVVIGMVLLAVRAPAVVHPYYWLAFSAFLVGVGAGVMNPASRSAGLHLAPGHASTLAALRSMCLQLGTMVTISITTAAMASTDDPGGIQAWAYVAVALIQTAGLPLLSRVPEHRGTW